MQKIIPFLWFDNQAEEAVNYYVSIFKNSKIMQVTHYEEGGPMPKGTVMTIGFQLEGMNFTALNGGPYFTFSSAISFVVNCTSQDEVDYLWDKLSDGGEIQQCGWLKDKFGVTWQIVPIRLIEMLNDSDKEKARGVVQAMLRMKKLDIGILEQAYRGE